MALILLIEDDPSILSIGVRALESMGHTVKTAEDAPGARKAFDEGTFDLVITDIKIPGEDGLGLVHRMRKAKKDQTIIITSGADLDDPDVQEEISEIGGITTLSKPFDLTTFMSLVMELLGD